MKKIVTITSKAIPLEYNNVDTDLIIPAQYLTSTQKEGYGQFLFSRLKEQDPQFVFNQPQYQGAKILIAGDNFGCGSSREHAVWALLQAGIEVVIAQSFADIFFANALKNGLALITVAEKKIKQLISNYLSVLTVSLEKQSIDFVSGSFLFDMDPFQKFCLLNGVDQFDYLLEHQQMIRTHHKKRQSHLFVNRREN